MKRPQIDPAAIRNVLADTFLIEVDAACTFPLRLSGTRLNALWLGEQKGRSFLHLWEEEERRCIAAMVLTVIDGVNPVVAGVCAAPQGRTPMNLELLLLPLRHNGKTHARVLGCMTPAAHEPWFGLLPADRLVLKSMRIIGPGETADVSPIDVPPARRWPEEAASQKPLSRRGHLTVYAGGV